jgi:hypothetical protein
MKSLRYPGRTLMAIACLMLGCDLSEVEIPQGEPVVVVQAVMRPDRDPQFVVIEQSFIGEVDYGLGVDAVIPWEGPAEIPIEGAFVAVGNLDLPTDSCGSQVRFESGANPPGAFEIAGVYWSPAACPTMRAGDRLMLTVETPAGDTVSGMAQVPGMNGAWFSTGVDSLEFGTDSVMLFNRDRDSLRVWVDASAGRLLQLEARRIGVLGQYSGPPVDRGAKIFADTTSMSIPGDLINVFAQGSGEDVFVAGRDYELTLALADTSYYDFARSQSNEYTGRGFINRLTGAVGVFGSLVATSTPLRVIGELSDERDGVYRLQGAARGIDIDAELSVYLARDVENAEFSGFLDGAWASYVAGPGGSRVWGAIELESFSVDGTYDDQLLTVVFVQPGYMENVRVVLRGLRIAGTPFRMTMADSSALGTTPLGTLTATQLTGG